MSVAAENNAEAWAALSMVREALEVLGPTGAVPRGEEFTMTFMDEAEALVAGVKALAQECDARRATAERLQPLAYAAQTLAE